MIIKIVFGNAEGKILENTTIIDCYNMHIQEGINGDGLVELITHSLNEDVSNTIHLGVTAKDHVYILDKGKTVDHMTFYPVEKS